MTESRRAHISLFAANLIYGANFSIAKIAMPQHISPAAFVLLRVLAATGLFFLLDRSTESRQKIERKDYVRFFELGLFGVAINQLLFFEGLSRTSNINASLIMTSTPILVTLMAFLFLKEHLKLTQVTGIALGMAGAVTLILQYRNHTGKPTAFGDFMVLVNAASYALYIVRAKRMMKKYDTWQVIKWTFFFGLLLVTPFGSPGLARVEWNNFTLSVWLAVGFVLLFTTFFAYLFNTYGLKHLSPSVVSFYIYLQPLFATLVSLLITHELISLVQIVACVLIFAGVYLVNSPALGKAKS
ncbi:MAG TPA: DMT family transporter [Bacteroidia bacterium]|nr:DMT family transporter [Bacteroidia bacterium]HNP97477.1 DMT family transporter [Bacteroidia bacterium]